MCLHVCVSMCVSMCVILVQCLAHGSTQSCGWEDRDSAKAFLKAMQHFKFFMLYAFIQQVLIMCPFCGWYCSRSRGLSHEWDRQGSRPRHQSCSWQLHSSQQLGLMTLQPVWATPWDKISKFPTQSYTGPFQGQYIIAKTFTRVWVDQGS